MSWQVLHVRPRCEKKLGEYCSKLRATFYLPLRSETKIYQRRKVTVEKPVFPGYVFADCNEDQRLGLLKTNTIVRTLEPEDESRLVFELDQIRLALSADPSLGATDAIVRGVPVRITGGPFMGIEGIVEAVRSRNKVCLNVDMIGRAVIVEVDRIYLESLD